MAFKDDRVLAYVAHAPVQLLVGEADREIERRFDHRAHVVEELVVARFEDGEVEIHVRPRAGRANPGPPAPCAPA